MNTLRECAEAAVMASGADGWQITGGTAHAWAVTLYFNRDAEVKRGTDHGADRLVGGRSSLVVTQVAADARGGTDPSPARRMWKRWAVEKLDNVARLFQTTPDGIYRAPYTILPGHDAVEQIEREAYQRGLNDGVAPFVTRSVTPKAQAQGEASDDEG